MQCYSMHTKCIHRAHPASYGLFSTSNTLCSQEQAFWFSTMVPQICTAGRIASCLRPDLWSHTCAARAWWWSRAWGPYWRNTNTPRCWFRQYSWSMSHIFPLGSSAYTPALGLSRFFILPSTSNTCYIYIEAFAHETAPKSLVVRNSHFKAFVIKGCYVLFETYHWTTLADVNEIGL